MSGTTTTKRGERLIAVIRWTRYRIATRPCERCGGDYANDVIVSNDGAEDHVSGCTDPTCNAYFMDPPDNEPPTISAALYDLETNLDRLGLETDLALKTLQDRVALLERQLRDSENRV